MKKLLLMTIISISVSASIVNIEKNNNGWREDFKVLAALNINANDTIKGLDTNKNGIRDDVENYIQKKYKDDPFQKKLFLEASKTIQHILTLSKNTPIKNRVELDNRLLKIYTCRDYMLYKLDVKNINKQLEDKFIFKSRVLNTNKRLRAYIEHKKALPFYEEKMNDMALEKDRISCERLYQKITNPDIASSK